MFASTRFVQKGQAGNTRNCIVRITNRIWTRTNEKRYVSKLGQSESSARAFFYRRQLRSRLRRGPELVL